MQIACPKCKTVQEVDAKTATCPGCRAVLRRCADCSKYDVRRSFCNTYNRPVDVGDATYPTFASNSTYCNDYQPSAAG